MCYPRPDPARRGRIPPAGPALDAFGLSGRRHDWLLQHFSRLDDVAPGTTMPAVQGTTRQVNSLAMFLQSLKAQRKPTAAIGQKVFAQQNCGYCPRNGGNGSNIGPSLVALRTPRTDAWILKHFRDPAAVAPNSPMPRVWAADWEPQSLLKYLKSIRK